MTDLIACGRGGCPGHVQGSCLGHKKEARGGGPCTKVAGMGTDHKGHGNCKYHGGASPNGAKHAQRQAAEAAIVTYGLPRDVDPADALLEEIHRTAGHVDFIGAQLRALAPDDLVWGRTKVEDINASEFTGVNTTDAAAVHVWLELYHRERRHLLDVCKAAIAAGIEERRVRLAEAQGKLAAEALRAILAGLNLTAEQRTRVPVLVREHMAELRVPAPSAN